MTPLRRFATTLAPFLVSGACAQLIGLSDYEKGEVKGSAGEGDSGGEGGDGGSKGGNGGTSGASTGGRGGSRTGGTGGQGGTSMGGEGGDPGEAGMGGEPQGGRGGMAGGPPRGGTDGGGMGGMAGTAGAGAAAGAGGSAGGTNCTTVPVPLASANFDGDNSVWIPYSEGSAIPINVTGASLGITADTAPNVAHLAGAHSQYSGQFQTITIPVGAVTMTLTGYWQVVSDEDPMSTNVYDDMAIQMWEDALPPGTGRVGEFFYRTHMDRTNGWTMFTGSVAVSAYAGQTVDLDMWGYTDDSILTDFYIDSLTLTALVCQ